MYLKSILTTLILGIAQLSQVFAQTDKAAVLTVGDTAPELQYSTWIKGTPFKMDEKDMVYVFEFWATWCGPCIAAMPHLSELAKKYEGKAKVVGVNVWEKTKEQPYESAIPAVEKFVNASGDRMAYNVIMDNNAQHMGNKWLFAAGQKGIPSTIVIKNGVIQWIGHPIKLDGPLDSLVNGTWDLEAFKGIYAKRQQASNKQNEQMDRIFKAVKEAADAADFEKLAQAIEDGTKEIPYLKGALQARMFETLLTKKSAKEAFAYADVMLKESPGFKVSLAMMVLEQNGLDKSSYLTAIDWLKSNPTTNSMILDKVADGYAKIGDYKSAISTMEQAVIKGEEELKDEQYNGRVFDYTVEGYKTKIKDLKKK